MTKNPLINATSASAYIVLVVSVMNAASQTLSNKPNTFAAPMVLLSLFTLSAAIMAFIFFYQPLQLVLDKKHQQAVTLFTQTVGIFAGITVVGLILLFLGVI